MRKTTEEKKSTVEKKKKTKTKSAAPARAICIVGMHRSGTSSVTRGVNLLGAYVGEPEDLMGASSENPEGFWERDDILDYHKRLTGMLANKLNFWKSDEPVLRDTENSRTRHLLRKLDTWDTVMPFREDWHIDEQLAPCRAELKKLINKVFGKKELWVWKDPRTCITLPLWKDVLDELGVGLSCVYVLRNPLDVARSLERRNGFPLDKSFGIWLNYNLQALDSVSELPHTFISYDAFIADWEPELRRCAEELKLAWPKDEEHLQGVMKDFVRPELRHSASVSGDLKKVGAPQIVIELNDILEAMLVEDKAGRKKLFKKAKALQKEYSQFTRFFRFDMDNIWNLDFTFEECLVQNEEKDKQLDLLERQLASRAEQKNQLMQQLKEKEKQQAELERQLSGRVR